MSSIPLSPSRPSIHPRWASLSLLSFSALLSLAPVAQAADGYGKAATGGAGGTTVTVTNATDLKTYMTSPNKYIVQVQGTIVSDSVGSYNIASNKTLIGIGTNPTIVNGIYMDVATNVIIQNLTFTSANPDLGSTGTDGIAMRNATNVFVTHCTFFDCADGSCDIRTASDFVTVSWCKFYYSHDHSHDFVNLIGAADTDTGDTGKLHITYHHNWYSTLCKERMQRVRFGRVHAYNNYYGCAGNNYCLGVGNDSQILAENNYFDGVSNPWKNYSAVGHQGLIKWNTGNQFINTVVPTWAPNSTVFTPSYTYTMDTGSNIKTVVTNGTSGAGAH